MTKTIRVKVTQGDIDSGIPHDSQKCPIALAGKRAFEEESAITGKVYDADIHPWDGSKACEFIMRFDHGMPVEPFEFDIEACENE